MEDLYTQRDVNVCLRQIINELHGDKPVFDETQTDDPLYAVKLDVKKTTIDDCIDVVKSYIK